MDFKNNNNNISNLFRYRKYEIIVISEKKKNITMAVNFEKAFILHWFIKKKQSVGGTCIIKYNLAGGHKLSKRWQSISK